MRKYYVGILGAGALVGSFLLTLWLTASASPPDIKSAPLTVNAEIFATYQVPDEDILPSAASAAGLQPSAKLKGFIDNVTRLNNGQVKIVGWAFDELGEADPIAILVFAQGKNIFRTQTKGTRLDVAGALRLSAAAAANVAFEGLLPCLPRQQLLVVAVTQADLYTALGHAPGPLVCPS
jgi:hypothetical protein